MQCLPYADFNDINLFEVRICISRQVQIGNSIVSLRKLKRHWGGCFTLKNSFLRNAFFAGSKYQ